VNVCSGTPVTMRQVMEAIGAITGGGELIRFGVLPYSEWDPPFICGDNRRVCVCLCQIVDWWKARRAA
jgi:hypothetical protein